MSKNLFLTLGLIFLLIANINFVYPRHIVWTEYSDSTSIGFTIDEPAQPPQEPEKKPCKPNYPSPEYKRVEYGQWYCVNHQMQRTNIIEDKTLIEYGGVCGFDLNENKKQEKYSFSFITIIFWLLILINLLLILIVAVIVLKKRY